MDTTVRYRSEYENYAPHKVYYRKNVRYQLTHEKFVVPWQLEDDKKEKTKAK